MAWRPRASAWRAGAALLGVIAMTGLGCAGDPAVAPARPPASAESGASERGAAIEARPEFNLRIPMRDGVTLSADVLRPDNDGKYPVILERTPYVKAGAGERSVERWKKFVSSGYVWVSVDVRGRGDSDGVFTPFHQEGLDGYDTIEWCAAQPWCNGKVGTIGGSYDGYVQWAAAVQRPPHLAAMVPMVSCPGPFGDGIQGGPTGLCSPMCISWYHFVSGRANQETPMVDWASVFKHTPLKTMDDEAGRPNGYWDAMIDHAQDGPWWEPAKYDNKFDRLTVPALHVSGWYDDEQMSTPRNYIGATTKPGDAKVRASQRLLMGPWPHAVNSTTKIGNVEFGPSGRIDLDGVVMRFFDRHLKGVANGVDAEPPVRIFVMGENRWRDESEWPIKRTRWTKYFLHSGGRANTKSGDGELSPAEPGGEPADRYTYDPADPVPFITEPSFAQIGGPDDYRSVEDRRDVLVYTTPAMTEATEVCGAIRVHLWADSSARDTDFTARLLIVRADGTAQRLCDGIVRARFRDGLDRPSLIEPGKAYEYDIDCWNTCQTFLKDERIRVEISSSSFPQWDANPNTGGALGVGTDALKAEQRVHHDRARASYVLLPIVPAK